MRVDGRQVVERHRLDAQGYRGSRDHATPPSASTGRRAARRARVRGHQPLRIVRVAGGEPRRAEAEQRRRQPGDGAAGRAPARRRARGPSRSTRDRRPCRSDGAGVGLAAADDRDRLGRRRTTATRSRGPDGSHSTVGAARRAASSAVGRSRCRRSARPSSWASVFAVASPTRRPVNAPGPVPTTTPARSARRRPAPLDQPDDGRQQLLRVAVAALERLGGEHRAVGRARPRRRSWSSPCRGRAASRAGVGRHAARHARAVARRRAPGRVEVPRVARRRAPRAGAAAARPRRRRSGRPAGRPAAPSPSRSGHSMSTTPVAWRSSSSPPSSASAAVASRYRSMWNSGSRPAYSPISTKLGELIVSRHAEARRRSPSRTPSCPRRGRPTGRARRPGSATAARRAASARVLVGAARSTSSSVAAVRRSVVTRAVRRSARGRRSGSRPAAGRRTGRTPPRA